MLLLLEQGLLLNICDISLGHQHKRKEDWDS